MNRPKDKKEKEEYLNSIRLLHLLAGYEECIVPISGDYEIRYFSKGDKRSITLYMNYSNGSLDSSFFNYSPEFNANSVFSYKAIYEILTGEHELSAKTLI